MALTGKRLLFVDEFMIDMNATQAAKRAGYSEKTAYSMGHELLKKPEIQAAIAEARAERSKRTEITQDKVIAELAKIGFADVRKAVAWGSTPVDDGEGGLVYPVELIPSSEIDDDTAAAITEVSLTAQGVKVKMADKRAALETLLKHTTGASDDEATSMTVTFNTAKPIKDIRVTRPTDGD